MIKVKDHIITPTIFPDGTSQVWKVPQEVLDGDVIEWVFEHESEVIHVAQLAELMDKPRLDCPYLPYGRQDKDVSNESTFALKTFALFINTMNIRSFTTTDAHSTNMLEYITIPYYNFVPVNQINNAYEDCGAEVILFPDKGAATRYSYVEGNKAYAEKIRDQLSGMIAGVKISDTNLVYGKKVLIVDDIIDGGRTFIELADCIKSKVKEINLYASHCICSKGTGVIHQAGISKIYNREGLYSS